MGSPIDRTAKTAMDLNLVNGVTSDAPKLKASDNVLYDYVDGLNAAQDAHSQAATLAHPDGSVKTAKIADGAVTTAKLADQAVTTPKIPDGAITAPKIPDGILTAAKFVPGVLTNETANGLQIVALKADVAQRGINVKYPPAPLVAAVGDGVTNDTAAIQASINYAQYVFFPAGNYLHTGLTISYENQVLIGYGQLYSGSNLIYRGSGTAITVASTAGYISFRTLKMEGMPTVGSDYFNTGSVGIDVTSGATSIQMYNCWLKGFETLVKSNYNSFYNKFIDCRFERALECLFHFGDNNFEVKGCRFMNFNNAITANGTSGPMTIFKNSFEVFNGYILNRTGAEEGIVHFFDNYVEIYDDVNLPTNFPNQVANGAISGKFGGNTLFGGPYKMLTLRNNALDIKSVFRIVNASSCRKFRSENNLISLYATGNNLNSMFSVPNVETYYINDQASLSGTGPYARTYAQGSIPLTNSYNEGYFYDCISSVHRISNDQLYSPTLTDGWAQGDANYGFPRMLVTRHGLVLQGMFNGSAKTGNNVFTIASKYRPLEINTLKGYADVVAFANYGEGNVVRFRYVYNTGVLSLQNAPADLTNINLDGIIIPTRI